MKDKWLNLNLRARKIWYEGSSIGRANGIVRLVQSEILFTTRCIVHLNKWVVQDRISYTDDSYDQVVLYMVSSSHW